AFERRLQLETLGITHAAVEGNPRHDLREGKMLAAASHFPYAVVRLLPDPFQMLDERQLLRPRRRDGSKRVLACLVDGIHELAVHVELQLTGGGGGARGGGVRAAPGRRFWVGGALSPPLWGGLPPPKKPIHVGGWFGLPRHAPLKPRPPRLSFLAIARGSERHQRQGRIAQPA